MCPLEERREKAIEALFFWSSLINHLGLWNCEKTRKNSDIKIHFFTPGKNVSLEDGEPEKLEEFLTVVSWALGFVSQYHIFQGIQV